MRPQPLICVTDVEASSHWYQRLLGCRGAHGGRQYEQLVKDGQIILQIAQFSPSPRDQAISGEEPLRFWQTTAVPIAP